MKKTVSGLSVEYEHLERMAIARAELKALLLDMMEFLGDYGLKYPNVLELYKRTKKSFESFGFDKE